MRGRETRLEPIHRRWLFPAIGWYLCPSLMLVFCMAATRDGHMCEYACPETGRDVTFLCADAAGVRRLTNFLLFHGLPSPTRLHQAKAKLSELAKAVGGGSAATVPLVALTLPNVPPKTLVKLAPLLVN